MELYEKFIPTIPSKYALLLRIFNPNIISIITFIYKEDILKYLFKWK